MVNGHGPEDVGLVVDQNWHVPNNEVVIVTVTHPKKKSETVFVGCQLDSNLIAFHSSHLSSKV